MMKAKIIQFAGLVLFAAILSCDDIFVEDISSDPIVLVAPDDSIFTQLVDHTFIWDELDGAVEYEVIISSGAVVVDTLTTKTSFAVQLDTGTYKWCVRGVNSEYKTDLTCRVLDVVEKAPEDIAAETVELIAPLNNTSTEEPKQVFLWEAIAGATQYQLVIASPSVSAPDQVVVSKTLTTTTYTVSLEPGKYEWCVKALNRKYKTENSCNFLEIKEDTNGG